MNDSRYRAMVDKLFSIVTKRHHLRDVYNKNNRLDADSAVHAVAEDVVADFSSFDLRYASTFSEFFWDSFGEVFEDGADFPNGESAILVVDLEDGLAYKYFHYFDGSKKVITASTSYLYGIKNIIGSEGNDVLLGDKDDNVIWGADGENTIDGREGNDITIGGIENTTYLYTRENFGHDIIIESGGNEDVMDFSQHAQRITLNNLIFKQEEDSLVIEVRSDDGSQSYGTVTIFNHFLDDDNKVEILRLRDGDYDLNWTYDLYTSGLLSPLEPIKYYSKNKDDNLNGPMGELSLGMEESDWSGVDLSYALEQSTSSTPAVSCDFGNKDQQGALIKQVYSQENIDRLMQAMASGCEEALVMTDSISVLQQPSSLTFIPAVI